MAAVAAPQAVAAKQQSGPARQLDLGLLRAVAEVVLPPEIGAGGIREALRDFVRWLDGFEPVAELPHPYLSSDEVRYGPPDPAPMWASQLEALDLLANRRYGVGFVSLPPARRRNLVAAALEGHAPDGRLPAPGYATQVALGLMARFYSRPRAADLAYGVRIGAAACRDLASGADRPPPLDRASGTPGKAVGSS